MAPTLNDFLARDWQPVVDTIREDKVNAFRLRVPGLEDFAVYGETEAEVQALYREALGSHLAGYLAVGKVVPEPVRLRFVTAEQSSTASEPFPITLFRSAGELLPA